MRTASWSQKLVLKIVSFNVNGIRARPHQLAALKDRHDPDIIGIQEVKVADEEFPREMVEGLGYATDFFGQKSHYGVALLSKQKPIEVIKGLPGDREDAQRRTIIGQQLWWNWELDRDRYPGWEELVQRIDVEVEKMREQAPWTRVTRSDAIRAVIEEGLRGRERSE